MGFDSRNINESDLFVDKRSDIDGVTIYQNLLNWS